MSSIKDLLTKGNRSKNLRWHNAAKCFLHTCIIWLCHPLLSKLCWKTSLVYIFFCVPWPIAYLTLRFPSFLLPLPPSLLSTHSYTSSRLLQPLLLAVCIIILQQSTHKCLFSLISYQRDWIPQSDLYKYFRCFAIQNLTSHFWASSLVPAMKSSLWIHNFFHVMNERKKKSLKIKIMMRITVHHWSSSRSIADCIWVVSTERVQDRLLMGSPGRGDYLPMQRELPQGRWKSCCVVDIPSSGCSCYWSRSGFCQGTESTLAIWSISSLFWAVLVLSVFPSVAATPVVTFGFLRLPCDNLLAILCINLKS